MGQLLDTPPEWLAAKAGLLDRLDNDKPVAWKYITEPDGPGRVKPARVLVVSARSLMEFTLDGLCVRDATMHPIPEEA